MDNKKKRIIKISVFIISIFVIFLSVTYAFINVQLAGTKKQVITAGTLNLILEEDENNLNIENAFPTYDEVGMIQEPFTFRLKNNAEVAVNYILKLTNITTGDQLDTSIVKYNLTKNGVGESAFLSTLPEDGAIDSGTIGNKETIEYTLRLWINSDVTDNEAISGKSLSYRVDVEMSTIDVYEDESGANIPALTSGMIPVTYDGENWVKADTSQEWYDYGEQWWANAVTVTKATRDTYMAMDAGEPINMDDINTMWVWIPRYEYQYTDLSTSYAEGTQTEPGEIKVNFISKDTTTPSDDAVYKIPEGFKFGEENIPGFWMAKFETSTLEECTAATDDIDTGCDLTTLTPQVKPNVVSWRGARVSTFFQASRLMQSSSNAIKYGFDVEGSSSMDAHMLKNSEWGIVAMLSQSKYGKYGNPSYTGTNKEVYQNKSDIFITGMSNGTPSTSTYSDSQVTYDTPDTGYGASTTGTIYGVYDMSGEVYEYVMGNYNNDSGYNSSNNSGFCGTSGPTDGTCREWPYAKYFDLYTSNIALDVYKFGDATYETSGWYSDSANSINSSFPWFLRGGSRHLNTDSGVFNFLGNTGISNTDCASRLAIKP